jgi:hypothetical protein
MDRYFYSVEMDGDRKVVHLSGNVYFNDSGENERDYRIAEWTFFYLTIEEIQRLFEALEFYDYINERVNYLGDRTEEEALDIVKLTLMASLARCCVLNKSMKIHRAEIIGLNKGDLI